MCCITYIFFIFFQYLAISNSFKLVPHAFEPRIAYIYGLKNLNNLNKGIVYDIRFLFERHPLLIFKKIDPVLSNELIHFLKIFDDDHNTKMLENLDETKYKIIMNT